MIRESEILRMCRDIPKDAVGLFEIFIHYGFPGWCKRLCVMSFNGNATADETYMRVWANGKAARHGDGKEVIVNRIGNRVPPVRNNSKEAKSAIELLSIVSSNLTMRTMDKKKEFLKKHFGI